MTESSLWGRLKRLLESGMDLVFPPKCVFCGRITEKADEKVCPRCEKELPYTVGGQQLTPVERVEKCVSPLYYRDMVRDSLLRYKFEGRSMYAPAYAQLMASCIEEQEIPAECISWVPISRQRRHKRGYDQSELLAKELAELFAVPAVPLLRKIRNNKAQSRTGSAAERSRNVREVYAFREEASVPKSVLLIDDIVTTGATLSECARILHKAGVSRVYAATVARRKD